MPAPHFRLVARADQRAFLALPWNIPLERWPADLLVEADRGIGRHVVRSVDAETGELHDRLSEGQRQHDLEIAEENLVGELHDLAAELEREVVADPWEFAANMRSRYEQLWSELTHEEVFAPGESARLEERLRRLNELGFDVE